VIPFHIIILAAGIGKRMKSKKVKVLHDFMGKPIIEWVVDLAKSLSPESIALVYGEKGEELKERFHGLKYAFQKEPDGTGGAVSVALNNIEDEEGNVIVLSGDTPLLSKESVTNLIDYHKKNVYDVTLMTFCPLDPFGYGRIIREKDKIIEIVEEVDATRAQKKIKEVNGGVYVFSLKHLREALKQLKPDNAQGEYYLTDVISLIRKAKGKIGGIKNEKSWELKGINTRKDLIEITEILRVQKLESLLESGVTILMPDTVFIEPQVQVGQDTIIYPYVVLRGNTIIGTDCIIEPFVYLADKKVPRGTTIKSGK
jgi:bifunctional UDP-N-acetylglucosamine pyrophosphorylase/glucosamine-1-phosphate N-acetyltransferase